MPADQRQALDMGQLLPGDLGRGALKQAVEIPRATLRNWDNPQARGLRIIGGSEN